MGLVHYDFEPEYSMEKIYGPKYLVTNSNNHSNTGPSPFLDKSNPFSEQQQPPNVSFSFLSFQKYLSEKCYGSRNLHIFGYIGIGVVRKYYISTFPETRSDGVM
jgi:hypothetical protein